MRKHIRLKDGDGGWLLSFTYEDNVKAHKVTGALVSRLIDAAASQRSAAVAQTEEFLEAMSYSAGQEMEKAQTGLREARQNGGPTERLELDAGQARRQYESLRDKRAEAHLRRRIEERKQGPMLQLLDPASLPAERFARQFAPWSVVLGAVGGLLAGRWPAPSALGFMLGGPGGDRRRRFSRLRAREAPAGWRPWLDRRTDMVIVDAHRAAQSDH
jgi:hypothetical protein